MKKSVFCIVFLLTMAAALAQDQLYLSAVKKFNVGDMIGAKNDLFQFIKSKQQSAGKSEETISIFGLEDSYSLLGICNYNLYDLKEAIYDFDLCIKSSQNKKTTALALYMKGYIFYGEKQYPAALAAIDSAINLGEDKPYFYQLRGLIFQKRGEPEKAKLNFEKVLSIDKKSEQRAFALHYLNRDEEALIHMNKFMTKKNISATDNVQMAAVLALLNHPDESMKYLDKALSQGFKPAESLEKEESFDKMRQIPEFIQLLQKYNVPRPAKKGVSEVKQPVEKEILVKSSETIPLERFQYSKRLCFLHEEKSKETISSSSIQFTIVGDKVFGDVSYGLQSVSGELFGGSYGSCSGVIRDKSIELIETVVNSESGDKIKSSRKFILQDDNNLIEQSQGKTLHFSPCKTQTLNSTAGLQVTGIIPGYLKLTPKGYSSDTYLFTECFAPDSLQKWFGLSSFNPIAADKLTFVREDQITSMNMDAIYQSIDKDQLFYTSNVYVDLQLSSVPELKTCFDQLKGKSKFEIAAEKSNVIRTILQTREKYIRANSLYQNTGFVVSGKCYAFEDDYNFDRQEVDVHLFIDNQKSGVYIATVRVPMTLTEASKFFSNKIIEGKVTYVVTPGSGRKSLGISGGGVSAWDMPDLLLIEYPLIVFGSTEESKVRFTCPGLRGRLWPERIETKYGNHHRWDLNSGNKPNGDNTRIITGVKL